MRAALARRNASIMMNISIRLWFVGGQVDCTRKTSSPRTFSSIFTKVSPSGNALTVLLPSSAPMFLAMDSARGRLDVPLKIFTGAMGSETTNATVPVAARGESKQQRGCGKQDFGTRDGKNSYRQLPWPLGWFRECTQMPPLNRTFCAGASAFWRVLLCLVVMLAITGCSTVGYYKQAAAGQYEVVSRQETIPTLLARTNTPAKLREKLELVLRLRQFAERELDLKTDGHYAKYADLGRRYVVWNVYAAPEFSMEPKQWWYPIVGRLKYRGFFSEADARACATRL